MVENGAMKPVATPNSTEEKASLRRNQNCRHCLGAGSNPARTQRDSVCAEKIFLRPGDVCMRQAPRRGPSGAFGFPIACRSATTEGAGTGGSGRNRRHEPTIAVRVDPHSTLHRPTALESGGRPERPHPDWQRQTALAPYSAHDYRAVAFLSAQYSVRSWAPVYPASWCRNRWRRDAHAAAPRDRLAGG